MFKPSEIGAKCTCDAPETVCKEHGSKRFRVPAGYYGGMYQPNGYYIAVWWTLECEQCHNVRDDFHVYKWHSNGDWTFVDGVIQVEGRPRKYPDIYRAILNDMQKPRNVS